MHSQDNITAIPKAQHLNEADSERLPLHLHEAFTWLPRSLQGQPAAEFAALVKDVAGGAACALEIVHMCHLNQDSQHPPLLNEFQAEKMLLLATRSLEMMADIAEDRIDRMERQLAGKGGAA